MGELLPPKPLGEPGVSGSAFLVVSKAKCATISTRALAVYETC